MGRKNPVVWFCFSPLECGVRKPLPLWQRSAQGCNPLTQCTRESDMSKFIKLVKLAAKHGTKQKTSIRSKTEEGTVTLSVEGMCATGSAEFTKAVAAAGAKMAYKAEAGFGEADGSGGMSLDGKGGVIVANEMMGVGKRRVDDDDSDPEDTPIEDKSKTGTTA